MRRQPAKELQPIVIAPDLQQDNGGEFFRQERRYEVITPLYGGGALPNECDPITVIRGTEVRGQLRFWWRACFAGRYKTFMELKKAEDALWGKAHKKGDEPLLWKDAIQIEILEASKGEAKKPFVMQEKYDKKTGSLSWKALPQKDIAPPYVAFPLRPPDIGSSYNEKSLKEKEKPEVVPIYLNVSFTLLIIFPATKEEEVKAALWAWETFGGIGARTRRGFGALKLLQIYDDPVTDLPESNQPEQWIQDKLIEHKIQAKSLQSIPRLSSTILPLFYTEANTATKVWTDLITLLADFRQAPHGRTGSSKWPEAKTIRRILGSGRNGQDISVPQKFPRALFGLPIVFEFPKEATPKTTLQGDPEKKQGRLASPLILKPLACKDNMFVGMAALLENSQLPPEDLYLLEENGKKHKVSAQLQGNEHSKITPLMGEADALKAFQKYLEKRR